MFYLQNPFVFKRKFTKTDSVYGIHQESSILSTRRLNRTIVTSRPQQQSTTSLLSRAWRRIFTDNDNEIDIEAQVEVVPEQNEPQQNEPHQDNVGPVGLQGTTEVYVKTAYLTLNGKPLNSIPLEGSTEMQAVEDYFMFMRTTGCISQGFSNEISEDNYEKG